MAPEWQKLAGAISPSIRVGAVDADAHKDIGGQYKVSGFPTIKLFGSNKNAPQDYSGARTAAAIAQAALKLLQDQVWHSNNTIQCLDRFIILFEV